MVITKRLKIFFTFLLIASFTAPVFADSETSILFKKGIDAVREGDFHDALSYFDKVLEQDPNNIDALANKAGMLLQLQRFEEADFILDKALALDPNHKGALNNKGSVLYQLERFEESIIYFDKALELDPTNLYALTIKSNALIQLERIDEADNIINKALSINPNHVLALALKSDILIKRGETSEAFQYLKRIAKIHPVLPNLVDAGEFNLRYKEAKGLMEIKITDLHGNLVGYLQTLKIRILEHEITNLVFDEWESGGETLIDGTKYEILQFERVLPVSENNIPGRTGFGIPIGESEDPTLGFDQRLWIIMARHPQYLVEEGDTLTISYTLLRPIA